LIVAGIVRRNIQSDNTIDSTKIAQARTPWGRARSHVQQPAMASR